MGPSHLRLFPPSWLRLPRRSARLRLTLLFAGLFLASGAVLLTITYFLAEQAIDTTALRLPGTPPALHAEPPPGSQAAAALAGVNRELAAQRASDVHQLLVNSAVALAVLAVLSILLGWYVAGRVLRPVRTITATARRISATNLHERLAIGDTDQEFKDLGDTLDDLFARLEAAFDAQRHFVANASHELRSPLTAERALLQLALDDPDTTAAMWRSTSQTVIASNRRQEHLIDALLALAASQGGLDHRDRLELSAVCDRVLLHHKADSEHRGVALETSIQPATVDGDAVLIERLVANLVDNAIKHNVAGGYMRISTAATGGEAILSVANTGPVIPLSDVDRLLQPFQRLDPRRAHHKDGHGLGLSIVRAIATAHGATLAAQPMPEGGLCVSVTFPEPMRQSSQIARTPRHHRSRRKPGAHRVELPEAASVTGETQEAAARASPLETHDP